jgi:hypothetical protein
LRRTSGISPWQRSFHLRQERSALRTRLDTGKRFENTDPVNQSWPEQLFNIRHLLRDHRSLVSGLINTSARSKNLWNSKCIAEGTRRDADGRQVSVSCELFRLLKTGQMEKDGDFFKIAVHTLMGDHPHFETDHIVLRTPLDTNKVAALTRRNQTILLALHALPFHTRL